MTRLSELRTADDIHREAMRSPAYRLRYCLEKLADRWWRSLTGTPRGWTDHDDEVPDHIGIGKIGEHWSLLATYGTGDDHDHIEIMLDAARLAQLYTEVIAATDAGIGTMMHRQEVPDDPA